MYIYILYLYICNVDEKKCNAHVGGFVHMHFDRDCLCVFVARPCRFFDFGLRDLEGGSATASPTAFPDPGATPTATWRSIAGLC